MKQKYQSKILEAIHEDAQSLYEIGAIDETRMKEYDKACLAPKQTKTPSAVNPKPLTPAYAAPHNK